MPGRGAVRGERREEAARAHRARQPGEGQKVQAQVAEVGYLVFCSFFFKFQYSVDNLFHPSVLVMFEKLYVTVFI